MYARVILTMVTLAVSAGMLQAQSQRRASIRGSGRADHGKCTIEVVVDEAADVEVRGDTAFLRTLGGRPAEWRRFECNSVMPPNPGNFRFEGIDGRGRQQLVRDPRNGGPAVVRIEDPKGGAEGYTFDLMWEGYGNSGGYPGRDPGYRGDRDDRRDDRMDRDRDPDRDQDAYHRDREEWFRRGNWRGRIFERVRQDVEHAQSMSFPSGGDQWRLSRTLRELDELQNKLEAGRYDERELDEVIGALARVLDDNRLTRRDRDTLSDDLDRLREFRRRHGEFGVR